MLVDSHLHLDFDDFAADRDAVMARAAAAGVGAYLCIGIRVRNAGPVRTIAERHRNFFCTVGTLPHHADEEHDVSADEIVALTDHPKVVGIGEAGLDRFYGHADWATQQQVFAAHIEAAQRTQLPLVIHSVREDETMARMLRDAMGRQGFRFVIHAFSGGRELAETALELGGYLGFGGLLTYDSNHGIRDIAARAPLGRLLLETDSPSLAPAPDTEARNEPANIVRIRDLLAELRGEDAAEIAAATTRNFFDLFAKVPRAQFT